MSLTGPIQSRYREAVHYVKDPVCDRGSPVCKAVQYVKIYSGKDLLKR